MNDTKFANYAEDNTPLFAGKVKNGKVLLVIISKNTVLVIQ